MKRTRCYIIIISFAFCLFAQGQQDIVLSQQQFSKINSNPAAIGTSNYINAHLFIRKQWAGFEGSPATQAFNVQGYVKDYRSGFGLSVVNDKIGTNKVFSMKFAYAYHLQLAEDKHIALGVSAGLMSRKYGGDIIFGDPETDPDIITMANEGQLKFRENIDLGISYVAPKLTLGVSATHVTRPFSKNSSWFNMPLQAYAFGEYIINIGQHQFIPRAQFTSVFSGEKSDSVGMMETMRYQFEAGGTFVFAEKVWIGAHYRSDDGIVALAGLSFGNLRVGYSYDIRLGKTFKNAKVYGSHEIYLNYRILIREEETSEISPRFFE